MGQINADTNKFSFGSGVVYVGDNLDAMEALGAGSNIKFEETYEAREFEIDNVGKTILGLKNHKALVSCDLFEIDFEKFSKIRGGIDNYSVQAGTLVENEEYVAESGEWSEDKFIELPGQNGNGSAQTIVSVTGSVDTALTVGDDYIKSQVNGKWGIIILGTSIAVTTEDQDITIVYSYTPAAKRVFASGGKVEIKSKFVQIRNTSSAGGGMTVTLFKAKNTNGLVLEFPADNADEPMSSSFSFTGEIDATRPLGERLFKIEDTREY